MTTVWFRCPSNISNIIHNLVSQAALCYLCYCHPVSWNPFPYFVHAFTHTANWIWFLDLLNSREPSHVQTDQMCCLQMKLLSTMLSAAEAFIHSHWMSLSHIEWTVMWIENAWKWETQQTSHIIQPQSYLKCKIVAAIGKIAFFWLYWKMW